MRTIIVTATDDGYAPLVDELLASINAYPQAHDLAVGVIDLGCSADRLAGFERAGARVVAVGNDLNIPERRLHGRRFLLGRTCKLALPNYFPDYDIFIWIDADAWVSDWSAIDMLRTVARDGRLAAVPDGTDPLWVPGMLRLPHKWLPPIFRTTTFKHGLRGGLSTAELRRLFKCREFNGGVYALPRDTPHWDALQHNMRRLISGRGRIFGSNQLALIMTVVLDRLPYAALPGEVNFTGTPMACAHTRRLLMPDLPHRPIGIMHMASRDAARTSPEVSEPLLTPQGGTVMRSIRYTPSIDAPTEQACG